MFFPEVVLFFKCSLFKYISLMIGRKRNIFVGPVAFDFL